MYTIEEVAANSGVEVWQIMCSLLDNEWLDPKAYKEGRLELRPQGKSVGKLQVYEEKLLFPTDNLGGSMATIRAGINKIEKEGREKCKRILSRQRSKPSNEELERRIQLLIELDKERQEKYEEESAILRAQIEELKEAPGWKEEFEEWKTLELQYLEVRNRDMLEDAERRAEEKIQSAEEEKIELLRDSEEEAKNLEFEAQRLVNEAKRIRLEVQSEVKDLMNKAEKRAGAIRTETERRIRNRIEAKEYEISKHRTFSSERTKRRAAVSRKKLRAEVRLEKMKLQRESEKQSTEEKVKELKDKMGPVEG